MIMCLPNDLKDIYPFICRNYGNIQYKDLLTMGYEEFIMKIGSIPESEPLFIIFKSRSINLGKIKDKEEREKFLQWLWDFEYNNFQSKLRRSLSL